MEGTAQSKNKLVGTLSTGGSMVGGMGTVFAHDGITPHIGDNMNWWIGDTDTGVYVKGAKGDKGDPFTYEDFTDEQIEALKGKDGEDGTMTFEDLTEEQKASLKGDKGDTGDSGVYIGETEPTDPNVSVWVNPEANAVETITKLPNGAQYIVLVDGEVKLYTPPKLISFTLESYGTPYVYQAEEGMTWREWVNSPYNLDGYMIGDVIGTGFDYVYQEMYFDFLLPDMVIQNGEYHTGSTI